MAHRYQQLVIINTNFVIGLVIGQSKDVLKLHRDGRGEMEDCFLHEVYFKLFYRPSSSYTFIYFHRGRIVDLAMVLQKALNCEEDIRLLIALELLLGDPAQTLACLACLEQGISFNCQATGSVVFTGSLLYHGIVLDSTCASDFHLVR